MELRNYLRILKRNWLIIVGATVAGLLVAGIASLLTRPIYTAYTELFVAVQDVGSVSELQQGNTFMQDRVHTYTQMVDSPRVLQPVVDELGLDPVTAANLSSNVWAASTPNTVLVELGVSNESPELATAIANSLAANLITVIDDLETTNVATTSPVQLSVLTEAAEPTTPSSPNVGMNLLVGLLTGLGIGLVVALLRAKFDTRIRSAADLHGVTKAPVLGMVRYDAAAAGNPMLTQTAPQSSRAEAFRQLRTNLQYTQLTRGSKVVQVTSSLPGEGKTTTAINLAIAMAQAGKRVALVDADLRRPAVAGYLQLESDAGLTSALIGQAAIVDLMQPWGQNDLQVLTSGPIPPNPSELLGSPQMLNILAELEAAYDAVIVDAPPVLPVTDAAVLSSNGVNTVLVVGAQGVNTTDVYESLKALELAGGRVLGLILNKLRIPEPDAKARAYYSSVVPPAPGSAEVANEAGGTTRTADYRKPDPRKPLVPPKQAPNGNHPPKRDLIPAGIGKKNTTSARDSPSPKVSSRS
ncbi:tyrosine-protein kinase domain-containing protein [Arthrobacter sp. Sr33]|uniref:polysaccharide biosynthesis tyrosine autokinase n=1 Tax=Arthrobacter sp. TB 23 TaxID=494419 RepID=UPI0002DB3809|nr:polysaccharide biosynthesis tyrosine autokinase [Arthrobacter sp. TB 23]